MFQRACRLGSVSVGVSWGFVNVVDVSPFVLRVRVTEHAVVLVGVVPELQI